MAWYTRDKALQPTQKRSVPAGLWTKCDRCGDALHDPEVHENLGVCPSCGHHFRIPAEARVDMVVDHGSWVEHDLGLTSADPLGFTVNGSRYEARLNAAMDEVGCSAAFRAATASIGQREVEVGFFVFEFMGGSMGAAVGEKLTRQLERAYEHRRPAVIFFESGGARMQEGPFSLMQMAKTVHARARLREANIPFISVLLHPTTGGVAASAAMLGDVILAEPGALIGFAGPRVIEQTIGQTLPDGFQRSEFLRDHGVIDRIVERPQLRSTLIRLLRWFDANALVPSP